MSVIRVCQFGEGNFLRTFVDHYFDVLNEEGHSFRVSVVRPIARGIPLGLFAERDNRYHIVLRGVERAEAVERVREIRVLDEVFCPFEEQERFFALATDPALRIIVSNTTEAGIAFSEADAPDGFATVTYPAKLTRFLYTRFLAGLGGVYILPVELIDRNADALLSCVERYITLWGLPEQFRDFNRRHNVYCNTLVDRIVSGAPTTEADRAHLEELIGEPDPLVSIGEPFGLWAIENKGEIATLLSDGHHGIDVIFTDDIDAYKKRKVRILNGSHTNLVPVGLYHGARTVYDCMTDARVRRFILDTVEQEILPLLSEDAEAARSFADAMVSRFENPYLNHRLSSISLNSISKWRARDLPTVLAYVDRYGMVPTHLCWGLTYLLSMYSRVRRTEEGYVFDLPTGSVPAQDDEPYLAYFADGGCPLAFMKDESTLGLPAHVCELLLPEVARGLRVIAEGGDLLERKAAYYSN